VNEAGEQFAPERPEGNLGEEQSPIPPTDSPGSTEATLIPPPGASVGTPVAKAQIVRPSGETGWMGSLQSLLTTVVIAVFVITFIVQAFQIPSESMENTLLIGDYLLVDKAHFGPAGPWSWLIPYERIKRGDVVVFRYPLDPKQHFVKRVIGTPGDHIRLINKRVFVNGQMLNEPYAIHRMRNFDSFRDNFPTGDIAMGHLGGAWSQELQRLTENGQLIVPDGFYFVMGDNRDDSSDSRYWGFVPRENIVGRPLVIYWSVKEVEPDDPDNENAEPGGKLTRFAVALKQGWQDLRWSRMLTLVH
jgi:signal peptidase I